MERASPPHPLLVADDPLVLGPLSELLELHGYRVHAASSPFDALDAAGATAFDVLVTDVRMAWDERPELGLRAPTTRAPGARALHLGLCRRARIPPPKGWSDRETITSTGRAPSTAVQR